MQGQLQQADHNYLSGDLSISLNTHTPAPLCNDCTHDSKLPETNQKTDKCFGVSTFSHWIILELKPTHSLSSTVSLLSNLYTSPQQTSRNVTYKILWMWFPSWKKISRETGEKGGTNSVSCMPEKRLRTPALTEDNQSVLTPSLGNNPHWIKREEVAVVRFLADYINEE